MFRDGRAPQIRNAVYNDFWISFSGHPLLPETASDLESEFALSFKEPAKRLTDGPGARFLTDFEHFKNCCYGDGKQVDGFRGAITPLSKEWLERWFVYREEGKKARC